MHGTPENLTWFRSYAAFSGHAPRTRTHTICYLPTYARFTGSSPSTGIKMRTISTLAVAALAGTAVAFAPPSTQLRPVNTRSNAALKMVYIPDGLSQAEWNKIKAEEKKKKENLGKMGPSRFKSRSFQVGRRMQRLIQR